MSSWADNGVNDPRFFDKNYSKRSYTVLWRHELFAKVQIYFCTNAKIFCKGEDYNTQQFFQWWVLYRPMTRSKKGLMGVLCTHLWDVIDTPLCRNWSGDLTKVWLKMEPFIAFLQNSYRVWCLKERPFFVFKTILDRIVLFKTSLTTLSVGIRSI